ncbi:MAG: hypothetical protein AB7O52_00680 [Planctomycetota bacterium]
MARASLRRTAPKGLVLLTFALGMALLGGCRRPDAVGGVIGPPQPPGGDPQIESIAPTAACAGEIVTIQGRNFSTILDDNIVTFRESGANPLRLQGRVMSVQVTGMAGLDTFTTMQVLVPTAVRDGNIDLDVRDGSEFKRAFGSPDFCGCPTIVGTVAGGQNDGALIASVTGDITTTTVTLYGYNLGLVTGATFIDAASTSIAAGGIAPGLPMGATFTVPAGMEAVTLTIPNNVLVNDCDEASIIQVRLDTACTADGSPLTSDTIPLRVQKSPGTIPGLVPATVQAVLVPSGVRAGAIEIVTSLFSDPASEQWECRVEFENPAGSGAFDPCTLVGFATPGVAPGLPPGNAVQDSIVAGIVAPGQIHRFVWDSAADLPGQSAQVRVRVTPMAPATTNFLCDPQPGLSELIALDNTDVVGGVGSDTIVVDMGTNFQQDESFNSDFTDANWDPTVGELIGTGTVAATPAPFGTGTVDVVLEALRSYEISTDIGEIIDVTNVGTPVVILGGGNNPGAVSGEFHVRTFVWEAGANVMLTGDNPLVIRCSGTGSTTAIAARFDGTIDLSGAAGTAAGAAPGIGGAGRLGGGNGGDGGGVTVMAAQQLVTGVMPAGDGGNNGGKGGSSMSFATAMGTSQPRPGPGGGGGHASAGEDGRNITAALVPAKTPGGKGGVARGDTALFALTAGSGGGGGGGCPQRVGTGMLQARFGGGGGGGGGAFVAYVNGQTSIAGKIMANGGDGGQGPAGNSGGGGGGGSGGSIGVFATGGIGLADASLLIARGGAGATASAGPTQDYRGGHGADGRIHLEANGGVSLPGLSNFTGLEPVAGAGVSIGATSEPINSGTGVDGALDLSTQPMGVYQVNTGPQLIVGFPPGQVVAPNGLPVLAAPAMSGGGEFNFTRLVIPAGYTLHAFGENPLVIRVQGEATISGVIDVSGANGGVPNLAAMPPVAGLGGLGGPGGGNGGDGGLSDGVAVTNGRNGFLPPGIPQELDGTQPPLTSPNPTGNPVPLTPATPAIGGESLLLSGTAGSGGGGAHSNDGADASGIADGQHGAGGGKFGNNSFLSPLGTPMTPGGSGGAGGGGSPMSPDGLAASSPGSGGGGAGGYLEINVGGVLFVAATAEILSRGGNAYRAAVFGGNGGAGAGGAIVLRGNGFTVFESPGPTISVLGGLANQDPTADPLLAGTLTYMPNADTSGGNGAAGRIRIESPIGFNTGLPTSCPTVVTAADPLTGICPPTSVGPFFEASVAISEAKTITLNVGGSLRAGGAMLMAPTITPTQLVVGAPAAKVLFRGAQDDFDNPGSLTPFGAWTDNPADLSGSTAIEVLFRMLGAPLGGGGTAQPRVTELEIPFEY